MSEGGTEHSLAGRGRTHRGEDVLAVGTLEQIADRTGGDRRMHGGVVIEHRQHQHGQVGPSLEDLAGRLQT
jgi:hypothetical protein